MAFRRRPPQPSSFCRGRRSGLCGKGLVSCPSSTPNYNTCLAIRIYTLQLQICEPNGEKEGPSKTITIYDELSLSWLPMGRPTISGVMCEMRSPGIYHPSIGKVRYSTYMQQRPADCLGNGWLNESLWLGEDGDYLRVIVLIYQNYYNRL